MQQITQQPDTLQTEQLSPWNNNDSKPNLENQNNDTEVHNQEEGETRNINYKRNSLPLPIPKVSSFPIRHLIQTDFQTIPRVYRAFQDKIRLGKVDPIRRSISQDFWKGKTAVIYHELRLSENRQQNQMPLRSTGKMANPHRFYSRKQQKLKGDFDQILRQTLKTPAVCSRIRNIVKHNMGKNVNNVLIERKYSLPFHSAKYCANKDSSHSKVDLRKTQIQFPSNSSNTKSALGKKLIIRREKKHVLDQFLERYQ